MMLGMSSETVPIVSIRQIRAARALLGWSQDDLADAAEIGVSTVKRLEAGDGTGPIGGRPSTVIALLSALIAAGVSFDMTEGSGPGVRLRE